MTKHSNGFQNRHFGRRLFAALLTAGILSFATTQTNAQDKSGSSRKIKVVCTTTMIADLARTIAGDDAEVLGIMRPGEDPHIYDVRPRDAQLLADADLILANGLHLEATLAHAMENNAKKGAKIVKLAETPKITALESEATRGAPDPHCWFNVDYFRFYAESARDALIETDPAHAQKYRERADKYAKELEELHGWVKQQIASIPREQRVMVTSHDAFQYYGRTYFIDVYAVIGISTEQQPKPGDIARLESIVRERGVKALFVETSVSETLNNIVKKVAESSGAKIGGTLYSDSLGEPGTEAGTYIGMVRHNTRTIVEALK
jgi:manganese/zinc/iron transport system substrate-binding protein